jgi:hypothetical protein
MTTKPLERAIKRLDLSAEEPFLIVAWKESRAVEAATVRLDPAMREPLRSICEKTLDSISHREMRAYDSDARLNRAEQGIWVESDRINEDAVLVNLIDRIPTINEITATAAASHRLLFYAIGFSEGDDLTLFVRRRFKQFQTGAKDKTIGLAAEALKPITKPIIVLDGIVDFIWRTEGIVAFDERAFDDLLRDPEDIAEELDDNLETISASLPFDDDTMLALHEHGLKGTMLRKKIRSLAERDYLRNVSVPEIRAKMKAQGIEPKHYVRAGKLRFEMARALTLFRFLAEGTWNGVFTGTLYGADGQARIPEEMR